MSVSSAEADGIAELINLCKFRAGQILQQSQWGTAYRETQWKRFHADLLELDDRGRTQAWRRIFRSLPSDLKEVKVPRFNTKDEKFEDFVLNRSDIKSFLQGSGESHLDIRVPSTTDVRWRQI